MAPHARRVAYHTRSPHFVCAYGACRFAFAPTALPSPQTRTLPGGSPPARLVRLSSYLLRPVVYLQWGLDYEPHPPPLPSHLPPRRRRQHGPAVARVAAGLGRRQGEGWLVGAAGAVCLPVLR